MPTDRISLARFTLPLGANVRWTVPADTRLLTITVTGGSAAMRTGESANLPYWPLANGRPEFIRGGNLGGQDLYFKTTGGVLPVVSIRYISGLLS